MQYLLVSPEHFGVEYSINPWMDNNAGKVDAHKAMQQWQNLKNILISKGVQVHRFQSVKNLPDIVFSANGGLVHNGKAFVPNFAYAERKGEEKYFENFFTDLYGKENVFFLPQNFFQEGAGDALFDRNVLPKPLLWAGVGFRSCVEAYTEMQKIWDIDIEILQLIHPEYYHLDISFAPLDGGFLMYAPQSFDEISVAKIEAKIPKEKRIVLSQEDLDAFNGNAVNVGKTVIVNGASAKLRKNLEENGYEVIDNDISEFQKAGGGNKCLTLRLE